MAAGSMLDETAARDLRSRFRGQIIQPAEAGYDAARRIDNAMIDRRPALIARCAGVSDVMTAVELGRSRGLVVSVRAGGHNVAGNAVCDGGVMIDLSPMKGVRVDPAAKTVRAEPGVTWGDFDRETQRFGLATTGGVISNTGIAGLTLGGGVGWLNGCFGLACDNLIAADVLTADGRLVHASERENEDLFWGLRGGGGNFGIVTSFEYRLHPLGPMVLAGPVFHPASRARDVLRLFRDLTASAPDELTMYAGLLTGPDGSPLVGIVACYAGPPEKGEKLVAPLREFGPPGVDQIGPMPYLAVQRMFDEAFPPGRLNYWKSSLTETIERRADRQHDRSHGAGALPSLGGDAGALPRRLRAPPPGGYRLPAPRADLRRRHHRELDRPGRQRAQPGVGAGPVPGCPAPGVARRVRELPRRATRGRSGSRRRTATTMTGSCSSSGSTIRPISSG